MSRPLLTDCLWYSPVHLRISKSLAVNFDFQTASNVANTDWAEDITAFSGDSGVTIWLEEVKKKFKAATAATVTDASGGWAALFEKYDDDGANFPTFS